MEFLFGIIAIVMAYIFFKKLLTSTWSNFKILTGIQRRQYLISLKYVDEYAAFFMTIGGGGVLALILLFTFNLDIGLNYTNLIKTLLFIFLAIISLAFVSTITWGVGVLVTNRFSLVERKEVYSDLLLKDFAGQFARIKIGNIFIVHLLTVLSILSVAVYVIYKIFVIIFVPIIMWLFTS